MWGARPSRAGLGYAQGMGRRLQAAVVGTVAGLAGWTWLALDWVPVTSTEMAPSLVPGDWVLLGPGAPVLGRVVALDDPAWPGRPVLRRVLGLAGNTVGVEDGLVVGEDQRLRIREMGRDEHTLTLAEDNGYLIRRLLTRDRARTPPVQVPDGQVWLLADNRPEALDSRWWGPVAAERIEQVVWLRLGEPGLWRKRVAIGGRDGPWAKPTPQSAAEPG